MALDNHTQSAIGPVAQKESGRWCEPNIYTRQARIFIFHPEERLGPTLGTLYAAVLDATRIGRALQSPQC